MTVLKGAGAGFLFFGLVGLLLGQLACSRRAGSDRANDGPPVTMEVVAVADDVSPLAEQHEPLPRGLAIHLENAPLPGKTRPVHFARIITEPAESFEQARDRVKPWFDGYTVPEEHRFAFADVIELNEVTNKFERVGLRSYLLKGAPVVTAADVQDASASEDSGGPSGAAVAVELTPAGSEKFRRFTKENIGRRAAILVNGKVESVPVIQSEIKGGAVMISMGQIAGQNTIEAAERLARGLRGRGGSR